MAGSGVTIKVSRVRLPKAVTAGERGQRMRAMLRRGANDLGMEVTRFVMEESLSGQNLKVRSGDLRGAVRHQVRVASASVRVAIGPENRIPYGRIQELGGDIVPRSAKYLWIPGVDNVTATGQPRSAPGDYYPFDNVVFLPAAPGEFEVFDADTFDHLFSLRRHVTLPARHWLSAPIEKHEKDMRQIWQDSIDAFVREENAAQ